MIMCGAGAPARGMQDVRATPLAPNAKSTPDAADTAHSTLPASPSRNPQNQIPAPPYTPPAPSLFHPPRAERTSTQPAPLPAKPVPPPVRNPAEFENIFRWGESNARPTVPQRRSAKPHPIAIDETRRSFPRPAENRSPSKRPAPRKTPPAVRPAQPRPPTGTFAENIRPPDAVPAAASRSSTAHPSLSHCS
jgi:hypothetical protein